MMSESASDKARIAYLENKVQQLSERVVVLETERQFMATKAEMIESRGLLNINIGSRKRKDVSRDHWINNDLNFILATIVMCAVVWTLTPVVLRLLQSLASSFIQ